MAKKTAKKKAVEKKATAKPKASQVTVKAPQFQVAEFRIRGNAPYVQNKFSKRAFQGIRDTQEAGQTAKKGKAKEAKDFQQCYEDSMHKTKAGWCGIPAPAFRCALISACRIVGFQMTKAKLSVFTEADGYDADDGTPLVKITKGEPSKMESTVRLPNGSIDIRARAMWQPGWEAKVRIKFDSDQFTLQDITNLMVRVGIQVGVGEGRPDSKNSAGMDWGTFDVMGR